MILVIRQQKMIEKSTTYSKFINTEEEIKTAISDDGLNTKNCRNER